MKREPYKIEVVPEGGQLSGDNWLVADFGVIDGMHYFLTTNHVNASESGAFINDKLPQYIAELLNEAYNKED